MKKNNIILPTAYLPPISYFYYLKNYKNPFIEKFENYQKQSIRNHAFILGPQGIQKLIIPIKKKSYSKTLIQDIEIANEEWKKKHIQSIQTNYGNSPFFIHYFDEICKIIIKKRKFLFDLNEELLFFFLKELDFQTKIENTKKYEKKISTNYIDLRNFHFKHKDSLSYPQIFNKKNSLNKNISIIDLLFNLGNESKNFITKLNFEKT